MKKRGWLLIAVLLIAVLVGGGLLYRGLSARFTPDTEAPVHTGDAASGGESTPGSGGGDAADAAPDFTVVDGAGQSVRLSDFAGKPAVVNFWATWCPPCRGGLPAFDEAFARCGEDVAFLMVDLTDGQSETVEGAQAFVEENGYTFPVYYDTGFEAAVAYGVRAIPMTVLVDAQGRVAGVHIGEMTGDALTEALEALLATQETRADG